MKKRAILGSVALLAAAAFGFLLLSFPKAEAQTSQNLNAKPIAYVYESGSVAAGAIITSPARTIAGLSRLTIICDNSLNGSTTAVLTIKFLERDCATLAGSFPVTCAASGTNGGFTFVQVASDQPGVSTTGLTQIPVDPPYCLQVSLAAAGSVARQVSIYGR